MQAYRRVAALLPLHGFLYGVAQHGAPVPMLLLLHRWALSPSLVVLAGDAKSIHEFFPSIVLGEILG